MIKKRYIFESDDDNILEKLDLKIQEALEEIQEVLPSLLELSGIEKTTQMLADEIEGTRRRVNALEHKRIPETAETIKYIEMKIAETQRETITRMIKIKDL